MATTLSYMATTLQYSIHSKNTGDCMFVFQLYYSGKTSSPVYSLVFNSHFMYLALDRGIHLIDFTVR